MQSRLHRHSVIHPACPGVNCQLPAARAATTVARPRPTATAVHCSASAEAKHGNALSWQRPLNASHGTPHGTAYHVMVTYCNVAWAALTPLWLSHAVAVTLISPRLPPGQWGLSCQRASRCYTASGRCRGSSATPTSTGPALSSGLALSSQSGRASALVGPATAIRCFRISPSWPSRTATLHVPAHVQHIRIPPQANYL